MNAVGLKPRIERFKSFADLAGLIRGFESGELPRAEWDHAAHLGVACWYLMCYPEPEATSRIRQGIRKYNEAAGIISTADSGYHETLTLFWIRMIRYYLNRSKLDCTLVCLVNDLVGRYSSREIPFEYYGRERLMSREARAGWIEPDLKRLP